MEKSSRPWWLDSLPEEASPSAPQATGLSSAQAEERLARCGPNVFLDHQEQPLWLQFLARFKNPLVILLLVASAISALTGEVTNFLILLCQIPFHLSVICVCHVIECDTS